MKRTAKRILSLVCVMAMLVTCLSGLTFTVNAAGGTTAYTNKWVIYQNDAGLTLNYQSTQRFEKAFSGFGVQIPEKYEMEDIALYMNITLDGAGVAAFQKGGQIELSQASIDKSERNWSLSAADWKVGENAVLLRLAASGSSPGGAEEFDLHKAINYFRMFAQPGKAEFTTNSTVKIYEIALVDISAAGVEFGANDTYLQLSEPLSATPNTIEASVKVEGAATSWSIGYPNGGRYSENMTNIGTGVVGAGEDAPQGLGYYAVNVAPVDEWSWAMANQSFTVNFPKKYEKEDLVLAFWLYTSTGEIGNGSIELTSSGTFDHAEISFAYKNYIENPKVGWNYVELPLASPSGVGTCGCHGAFDYTNANFIRWVGAGAITQQMELRISEMKFISLTTSLETPGQKGWALCNGFASASGFNTGWSSGTSAVTYGNAWVTDNSMSTQPPAGTVYAEFKSNGKQNTSGSNTVWCPVFTSSFAAPELLNGITLDDLVFSGWFYISDADLLLTASPWFWINSQGDAAVSQLSYSNLFANLKDGWNYIEIPLSEFSNSASRPLDLTNICLLNLRSIELQWVEGTKDDQAVVRYADFRLTAPDFVEAPDDSGAVVTEDDYVIFGNTNTADENPIALFLDIYGNVGWAWGDTRYVTQVNVATGEWVDLALVRDMTAGKFILYVDGVQKHEVSAVGTADIIPTVPHMIGTDGLGEMFKGMIADVRAWSDVRTADEINNGRVPKTGNKENGLVAGEEGLIDAWMLVGNLNYVLGGSVAKSTNGNDLVFGGSRADDWEDYEIPTDVIGEDYYTMVFIPDTQEIATGAFTEEWMASAQWIADNVEKENIVHVFGAGDTTWTDSTGQWNIIKTGFDLFTDKVSWSNATGNHDYPGSTRDVNDTTYTIRNTTNYNNYFGIDYINSTAAANTYCGSFEDDYNIYGTKVNANGKYVGTENSYYRFTVNGVNWMVLQVEYHPRVSVINWACDILEQYPDDNVIFTTHAYIGADNGRYSTHWMPYTKSDAQIGGYIGELMPNGATAWPGGSEQPIWTEILYKHNNVKLLLCGHDGTTDGHVLTRWDENVAGNVVPQVMINAQDLDVSYFEGQALAMLGILRFSADGSKCEIQYYSAYHDSSYHPSNQHMRSLTLNTAACDHTNVENRAQVDPTCTETGLTAGVWCIPCHRYISGGEEIPVHAKEDRAQVDPTCTETGLTAGVWCTVCEKYLSGGEVIAEHLKVEREATEPTCTRPGHEAGLFCSVCRIYLSGGAEIPAHVTEEHPKVPATCTEAGHTAGVWCTECEKYVTGGALLPIHAKEERPAIPPTATEPGREAGVWCIPCEKYIEGGEIIPPTGGGDEPPAGGDDPVLTVLYGDVDGNDKIDSTDARLVLQYAVGKIGADDIDLTAADVDGSGKVDSTDARLILQYAVGKIQAFAAAK